MTGYKRYITWKQAPVQSKILQIYSKGLEYALVSENYEQCHPFVWCKDFLHDVIFGTVNNRWFEVYKFRFNPALDPVPCLDKIRLLLTNSKDKRFSHKIPAVLDFINQIEDRLNIKKTFARKCHLPPEEYRNSGVYMFQGSRRWLHAPPMLSLYSLLLRVGFVHTLGDEYTKTIKGIISGEIKPYQKKDTHWLKSVEPALQTILRIGDRRIFYSDIHMNYPSKLSIDTIHNRMGIIGFASDMLHKQNGDPILIPYWQFFN